MSVETIRFLLWLLDQLTLSASAPDFAESAARVVAARHELEAQLAQLNELLSP